MNKIYHFHNDLYGQDYYFCPTSSERHLKRAIKEYANYDIEELDLKTNSGLTIAINGIVFIWLKNRDISCLPQLSHESTHAAFFTLKERQVRMSPDNDEPLAYLVEWIFGRCLLNMKVK